MVKEASLKSFLKTLDTSSLHKIGIIKRVHLSHDKIITNLDVVILHEPKGSNRLSFDERKESYDNGCSFGDWQVDNGEVC